MAIPAGALHHVLTGRVAGGESFACGYWVNGLNVVSSQAVLDGLNTWAGLGWANTFLTSDALRGYPPTTRFDTLASYFYGVQGDTATLVSSTPIAKVGAGTAAALPNQLALVASFRTARPGRSFRGRTYLPAPNATQLGADGQPADVYCQDVATRFAAMLGTAKSGDPTIQVPGTVPVVVSRLLGAMTPITQVIVDSRLDVQRGRAQRQNIDQVKVAAVP